MDDNPVQRAVDILGGALETQIAVRVKYWTLRGWIVKRRVPTTRYAVLLSEATGGRVSVKELAGLEDGRGPKGRGFLKGGQSTVTYPAPAPIRAADQPDTAALAA